MSNSDLTSILFILLLLVGLAQLLGYFFVKLRQPKVVGEILAESKSVGAGNPAGATSTTAAKSTASPAEQGK